MPLDAAQQRHHFLPLDDALYARLDVAREAAPFVGPNQEALEQLSRVADEVAL